jgi:hypothetical protein
VRFEFVLQSLFVCLGVRVGKGKVTIIIQILTGQSEVPALPALCHASRKLL